MSKIKFVAALAILAGLSACTQPGYGGGQGVKANCALMGAAGGAALGAISENDVATSAIVGGLAGAAAGNAGMCN